MDVIVRCNILYRIVLRVELAFGVVGRYGVRKCQIFITTQLAKLERRFGSLLEVSIVLMSGKELQTQLKLISAVYGLCEWIFRSFSFRTSASSQDKRDKDDKKGE